VLDIAISETRQLKAVERGISSTALTPEVLVAAEEIFISLDAEHAGYVSIWALTSVFAVLGVHISDEDMDLLIQELELDGACALSFPEVIDVASFLINKSSRNISGRGSFSEL
jgi:Ca2+-binding EF-hand superfamily protein